MGKRLKFPKKSGVPKPGQPVTTTEVSPAAKAAYRQFLKNLMKAQQAALVAVQQVAAEAQEEFCQLMTALDQKPQDDGWRINLNKLRWEKYEFPDADSQ